MGLFDILLRTLAEEEKAKGTVSMVTKDHRKVTVKPAMGQSLSAGADETEFAKKIALEIADLERRKGALQEREKFLEERRTFLDKKIAEAEDLKKERFEKLQSLAKMTYEEAKKLLLEATEKKMADEIARRIKEAEEEVKAGVEEKAKEILVEAMKHGATDYVAEYTVSTIDLPNAEMKGRIIGREGRNIRSFERATGVEIELDEGDSIHLSSFDPIRREVARRALLKLIRDQRIQPARIEELVRRERADLDKVLFEEGEKLCHAVGVYRLHPELVKLLGRFKFRFSYGQNMIQHTLEETQIGVQLAKEVNANVNVVRLGCLLHDIGKVVADEEGTHIQLGVETAKKYRLPPEVIACIAEHHEDKAFSSVESRVVWIADAISGSRPGARYEGHGEYVERMEEIEKTVKEFPEVQDAYAYQAGRYVMVLVKPEMVSDSEMIVLAQRIREKLEEGVTYSGQIKISCIRESQVTETTKAK